MAMATLADSTDRVVQLNEQLAPGRLDEIERRLLQEKERRELAAKGPDDLEFFARAALKLRPKVGAVQPFVFNAAQQKLHAIIEGQKVKTGRVRVIILKARQLGVSTYVAARLFHRTIFTPGLRTIIVGHERRASSNLFQIVKRFYENLPADVCPPISASNAEELLFDKIDSGYIGTVATTEGAGRSATAQALHASEVAFWPDLPVQMAALMQTVPDLDDTEVILETTANGFNDFHSLWRKAETGESEFLPIFLPWTLDAAYARLPDAQMTAEEASFAELYGLNAEQVAWRRAKVSQLGSDALFQQEYPLVASEAFISPERESFIPVDLVVRARRENVEPAGPLIVGVDPAGSGADRTAIAWRRGRCVIKVQTYRGMDTMQIAGLIAKIMREEKPAKVAIDVGGLGVGVYDRLTEQGFDVTAVNFGGKPVEPAAFDETGRPAGGPANRRAELWLALRKALEVEHIKLPDRDSLQADLVSCGYRYDSSGRMVLESKQDMRRRGVPSPDEGDAVALCFSEPVIAVAPPKPHTTRRIASWMAA
jgi:hypothetical protein